MGQLNLRHSSLNVPNKMVILQLKYTLFIVLVYLVFLFSKHQHTLCTQFQHDKTHVNHAGANNLKHCKERKKHQDACMRAVQETTVQGPTVDIDFLSGVDGAGLSLSREPRNDNRALHRNMAPNVV